MSTSLVTNSYRRFRAVVREFLEDQGGPTAVEYAILLAVIVLAAIGGISALGRKNSSIWAAVGDALGSVL